MNHKPDSFAINKTTNQVVPLQNGVKGQLYRCPHCYEDVLYKHGEIVRPYFCHKNKSTCSNYDCESEIHRNAKQLLQNVLEARENPIHISRKCRKCNNPFLWTYGKLLTTSTVNQEHPFIYNGSNRRADVASIGADGSLECIFEICNTNQTTEDKRPEPWFEFDAINLCDKLQNIPEGLCEITLDCIRKGFIQGNESYGLCVACELEIEESQKGKIYFNQRGAGCGKTYESIQLINGDSRFNDKSTFIYLTKMRSAKDVIFAEFQSQMKRGNFPNFNVLQNDNKGNQYLILLEKPDKTVIKIIIGTIDSFTYAIRDKNKVLSGGSDCFQKLVKDIRDGNMTIETNGDISYASTRARLTNKCLIIIDEGQDLEIEYINAFEKIIDRTGIDTYIIGDKLQSILSEQNLFTHLENTPDTVRIIKNTGDNIIKRCHNTQFKGIINETVLFEKWNLPPIKAVCSGVNCGYTHEDDVKPYIIDTDFKNIFKIEPDEINRCIKTVLQDIRTKTLKHGYLPHNFMFIFPVVNEKNKLLSMLYPAIQEFWIDFFSKPESYTDLLLDNMKKSNDENEYWSEKIENKENDERYYQYVFWHRSEVNQPINLNESKYSSKMLSIHTSKGNGCECVYLLGLSEFTLACHTGGISNTLVYESLFHVGMTRQKKYLFVGIDGSARDDICRRFGNYYLESGENEPYIKNITDNIRMTNIVTELSKGTLFEKVQQNILLYDSKRDLLPNTIDKKELVDWGDHIIRTCSMRVKMDYYMLQIHNKQQDAKINSLLDPKKTTFNYCNYSDYKERLKQLDKTIRSNIKANTDKTSSLKCLIVPILIFHSENDRSKTDYARYRNAIKQFIDRIKEKLKSGLLELCPIECLIYCHLMEITQHPYTVSVSIMDIYRIISCYDDCYSEQLNHHSIYECKCSDCFSEKRNGFIRPHQQIHNSVVNHHKSIERMDKIIDSYSRDIKTQTRGESIEYRIDKSIPYDKSEFSFGQRLSYIGYSDNYVVFMILTPQFNLMNLYDILTKIIIHYFFLQKTMGDKYSNKTTLVSIITLDSDVPIIIDLTSLLFEKMDSIKMILKEFLLLHFSKEHKKIYNFFVYHREKISYPDKRDKSDLLYVVDILETTETITINGNPVTKCIYPLPKYILSCFKEMDKNTKTDKIKRKEYRNNMEEFILKNLQTELDNTINNYLGINIELSDDEDL